jgi:hypothetical protein
MVAGDHRRQVALVGDVEEDREHADDEADDVELDDRQGARHEGERDRGQGRCPAKVAGDHHRPATQPVDPHARRQADQQEWQEDDDVEKGDLEGRGLQDVDGHERDRQRADLGAELADRLGRPETDEVGVAQEARGGRGRRRRRRRKPGHGWSR